MGCASHVIHSCVCRAGLGGRQTQSVLRVAFAKFSHNDLLQLAVNQHQDFALEEYKIRLTTRYHLTTVVYTTTVWQDLILYAIIYGTDYILSRCSRISLSLSIARILPPSRLRQLAICLAMFCFVSGVCLDLLKACLCKLVFKLESGSTTLDFCPGTPGTYLLTAQTSGTHYLAVYVTESPRRSTITHPHCYRSLQGMSFHPFSSS